MRFVVGVLIAIVAIGDAVADTSQQDKITHIIETEDYRGQIVAYGKEMTKRSLEESDARTGGELDERAKEIITEEMDGIFEEVVDDYIEEIIAVYVEHLSPDEIDAIYEFYRSPEGMSFGSKLPAIERELFWIDARYLELIAERAVSRITERLSQEGYD